MKFITAKDIADRDNTRDIREWIGRRSAEFQRRRGLFTPFTGMVREDITVDAEVNFGRWIALCPECRGAEYVDPDDPIFYCLSCGNSVYNGDALTVVFPDAETRVEIENALSAREIDLASIGNPIDAAVNSRPVDPLLPRNWKPGETVKELLEANAKKDKGGK